MYRMVVNCLICGTWTFCQTIDTLERRCEFQRMDLGVANFFPVHLYMWPFSTKPIGSRIANYWVTMTYQASFPGYCGLTHFLARIIDLRLRFFLPIILEHCVVHAHRLLVFLIRLQYLQASDLHSADASPTSSRTRTRAGKIEEKIKKPP
jgi:hypothetical protein